MTCGCKAKRFFVTIDAIPQILESVIVYCPLHRAAPELLIELKNMTKRFADLAGERPHDFCGCSFCCANQVIQKSERGGE